MSLKILDIRKVRIGGSRKVRNYMSRKIVEVLIRLVFLLITLFCTQKIAKTRFVFKNAGHKNSKNRGESRKVRNHMGRKI